jgi:hypothetical protein
MNQFTSTECRFSLSWISSILAGFIIAVMVLVAYHPALSIGFWTDDYTFVDMAGRFPLWHNIVFYFDPLHQGHWYRPAQGMAWWISYQLFRGDATWYHLIQILIHIANALLLFALVTRVTRRWRLAFLAALVYAILPVYALAVYWPAVADPLASLFYLLTLWFWIDYLRGGGAWRYALTWLSFVAALFSKETNATLLIAMALAGFWLVGKPSRLIDLIKRYALFVLPLPVYALAELSVLTQGVFTNQLGYGTHGNLTASLVHHLSVLAFPWGIGPPWNYCFLAALLGLFVYALYRRAWRVIFVGAAALLAVLPVLPFPVALAQAARYLYLPLMASGILFAWLIETGIQWSAGYAGRWVYWAGAFALALMVLQSSATITDGAVDFAGTARVERLQFRPIYERHLTFPSDTFLYFINPPFDTPYIDGMMLLRYGANVTAYGADRDHIAPLRESNLSIVYYQDDQKNWLEQTVDKNAIARAAPRPPIQFDQSIALVDFEIANPTVSRGDPIFLILYWKSTRKIDKDYTVFVHLVDPHGKMIAGVDSPPRQGNAPTSHWRANELIPDSAVFPIDTSVPSGEYQITVGLYDPATMQRLSVLDASGNPMTDKVVIAPITVEGQVAR